MRSSVLVAAVFAAVVCAAAAQSGCCGPKQIARVQFGFSYVSQNPAPGQMTGPVNQMISIDFDNQVAVAAVNNFTTSAVVYTRGDLKETFVYVPQYNVCVNTTYNPAILQRQPNCVGPGTKFPNQAATINLGGLANGMSGGIETESWGAADKLEFVNVNMNKCIIVAVSQSNVPPLGTALGVFYNVTGTFDSSVFDLPSACTKSSPADIVSALPHPRALRELNAIVDVATTTAAASRSPYGM